jgi:hypothetical protein
MKTPHLLVSFAVAATASAAELKDPAEVARDWNRSIAESALVTGSMSLREIPAVPPRRDPETPTFPLLRDKPPEQFQPPPWSKRAPRDKPAPREPLIDSPSYRIPDPLPNDLPRGTKPWEYGGQKYWIVPLIPSREK